MITKELGKITFAEYGLVHDRPFLMGLQLGFKVSNATSIMDGCKHTVNISKECRWSEQERKIAMAASVDKVYQLLTEAKVNYVSELVGIPVEVTIEDNWFKDFRILTEVL